MARNTQAQRHGPTRRAARLCRGALATIALLLWATSAAAQNIPRYDLDGDGRVSRAEFRKVRVDQIMRFDRDKDGRVTRAESKSAEGLVRMMGGNAALARIEEIWTLADVDRDGVITREEAVAFADGRFTRYSMSRDGWLSSAELNTMINDARKGR